MASLVGIMIIVTGVVFTTFLLGFISYDQFKRWTHKAELNCNCVIDIDSDVYPWQASLGKLTIDTTNTGKSIERLSLETHLCGSVLINEKYAIASAHCVRFNYDQQLGIGFGSDLLQIYNKGRIPIKKIYYNSTNQIDDIALIELEKEVDFKNEHLIRPACFNRFNEKIGEYANDLIATGWNLIEKQFAGKDYFTINRYHMQMKFRDVSVEDRNCNRKIKLCVRSKETKNCDCYPDSSAPLHLLNQPNITTVVGLHQVPLKQLNGTIGCPEIYFTRISTKLEFIQSIVKNQICLI